MNYVEMSDEEINNLVIKCLIEEGVFTSDPTEVSHRDYVGNGWNWGRGNETRLMKNGKPFIAHNNGIELNYCNSWADAGPIIIENNISLSNAIIRWDASSLVYDDKFDGGFKIYRFNSGVDSSSRGALRAAMSVFLMMREGK